MFDKSRRLLSNPLELVRWIGDNPRTAALAVAAGALLVVLAVLSFGLGLAPDWTVLFGIALVSAWLTKRNLTRVRLLQQATATAAGSLSPGVVAVSGRVEAADDDRVSHDGDEYVAYRYRKLRRRQSSEGGGKRVETDESRAVPFHVSDDTGSVLVDTNSAAFELSRDQQQSEAGSGKSYLATLRPGDEVRVYGTAMRPDERAPRSVRDAASEGASKLTGRAVGAATESGSLVVSKGERLPDLVVTDRSGWRLLARSLVVFLGTLLVTLATLGFGTAVAVGLV
jgi:hypothetical protein